jgi:putative ABC transport system permease protein
MSTAVLVTALNLGLLYGIMALGIFVTFRILNFADLTVEGSFTLGAAVAARLFIAGVDPLLSTLIAVAAGMAAGFVTGFFHTVLKIPPLLSGILTMTGVYSVNLRIMGRANVSIMMHETLMSRMAGFLGRLFTWVSGLFGNEDVVTITARDATMVVGFIFVAIILFLMRLFFNTEIGCALRATGDNEAMVKAQGVNTNRMKVLGLMIANACVALSGALVFQQQRFADLGMGIGIIVIGLAAVIIGEVIFRDKNRHWVLVAVVLGSILYRIIIAFVLRLEGIDHNDVRLFTALMIALVLSLPMFRSKLNVHIRKLFWGSKPK